MTVCTFLAFKLRKSSSTGQLDIEAANGNHYAPVEFDDIVPESEDAQGYLSLENENYVRNDISCLIYQVTNTLFFFPLL